MGFASVNIIVFSPTNNTRRIALNVVNGLALKKEPTKIVDITNPDERMKSFDYMQDDLALFAVPCYGGRLPSVEPALFGAFSGKGTPAILVVTYGTRGYDNELHEMKAELEKRGFVCVAAAAFPAVHTFSKVVGAGRPNSADFKAANGFGEKVRQKFDLEEYTPVDVPGASPYPDFPGFPYSGPVTDETCTGCNACYRWCPVRAIPFKDPTHTDNDKCIRCHSCIVHCPIDSRSMQDPVFHEKVAGFEAAFKDKAPEPEIFL